MTNTGDPYPGGVRASGDTENVIIPEPFSCFCKIPLESVETHLGPDSWSSTWTMPLGHQCHGNETKQIVACLGILIPHMLTVWLWKTNVDAEKVSREVTLQESRLADFLREKKHR